MPEWLWNEVHPSPSFSDRCARRNDLSSAITRFHAAGKEPKPEWLEEYSSRTYWWRFELAMYLGLPALLIAWAAFHLWVGSR